MRREANPCQSSTPRTFLACKSRHSCPVHLVTRAYVLGFARSLASSCKFYLSIAYIGGDLHVYRKRPASGYSPTQSHSSLPGNGYPPTGGYAQGSTMGNGFNGQYIKSEEEVGEPSAKRQRGSNTSPSQYLDRGAYGSLTPQAYANPAAYTDAQYSGLTSTTMAIPDNNMLQQSPGGGYSANGMPFRSMPQYNYPDDRTMYSSRGSDAGSASGYPAHATYGNGYQNGSPYASGSSTNIPGYYPQSNQPFPRQPPQ